MPDEINQPSERRRHRRRSRHHPARRLRRRVVIALAASTVLVAAVWVFAVSHRYRPRVDNAPIVSGEQYEWLKRALAETGNDAPPTKGGERPFYKFSVVPGGVYDAQELQRAMVDPVVAAHYEKLDRAKVHIDVVAADRLVHVSYRKDDKIYWSTKKVLLRKGETILTDGTTQIRSRCGNCISDEPLGPTAADEPDVLEFDRLVDSSAPGAEAPGKGAANVPASSTRTGLVAAAGQTDHDQMPGTTPTGAPTPMAGGAMPFFSGGGGGGSEVPQVRAKRSGTREPGDTPGDESPDGPSSPDNDDSGSTPPGNPQGPGTGSNEPPIEIPALTELPVPPSNDGPPKFEDVVPPEPDGPNGLQGFGPQSEEPAITDEPANPVPVPEPGTLMLVGGGVAALVRRLRSRSPQQ